MPAPQLILDLIERFERNKEAYKSGAYNETQVRREFIDPFFEALGWDVNNKAGNAEAYKDVIHEDAVKVGGVTKAPDYSFRIGGQRKFFVEAKQPSINIKDTPAPAFQVRRYAWSAKLPLSIVTDFDEFAVYDCRIKPDQTDKSDKARIKYYTCGQYAEKWDEIASVFSKDAILKGSFDKYAESNKGKRGTAEVDSAFLAEIENWREMLARNIALRNSLSVRELNDSVQRIIDRIIFLRIAEDRGIEDYGALRGICNGSNTYVRLQELFEKADDRYNSGLFHFRVEKGETEPPDRLTPSLVIDDKPLRDILKTLYYPDSPYEFAVLPADILGQVYEQFLGRVVRLTSDHRAVVEDKPEVKKAGGVFYTPTYIVDYIVQNTVGKLLEGKTPRKAESLRILDPACGSGSFLLGAYQYLLDWHLRQYVADGPEKHTKAKRPALYSGQGGAWHLTTAERKRILLNNIYGVDIDHQAVEVTKLSLLLKVLEDETAETLNQQRKLFHERALPDLGGNIKCGNSLIGPDFYDGKQMNLMDTEEAQRVNVFDWQAEFPDIFKAGGFDAVIGNPPWISLSGKFRNEVCPGEVINFLIKKYNGNTYMPNMYEYFTSQGLNLTCVQGYFSFIVPDRLGFNGQFIQLRKRILNEANILSLVYKIPFPGITADTLIFVFQKGKVNQKNDVLISEYGKNEIRKAQIELLSNEDHVFNYFDNSHTMQIVEKIESTKISETLNRVCDSTSGFGGKSKLIMAVQTSNKQIQAYKGDSIGRYEIRKTYWFDFKKENITGRTTDKNKLSASPKILIRKTGDHMVATYDTSRIFPEQSLYFLHNKSAEIDYKYLLGILNSCVLNFYFRAKSLTNKESIAQVKKIDLDKLPIRIIDFKNATDKARHDRMVQLVEQMLALHKQLANAKTGHEQTLLQRQIDATDRQIDKLVYELYDLTEDEIKIVEGR